MNNRRAVHRPGGAGADKELKELEKEQNTLMVDSFMKSYLDLVPKPQEMSNLTYWSQEVLNEIDSRHLQTAFQTTHSFYKSLWSHLVNQEGSPYKEQNSLTYEEFLWAFTLVSSRHVVFDGHKPESDPDLLLVLMPFLDMINHSRTPNVAVLPHIDKFDGERSYLVLKALKDIQPNEQLSLSYGEFSNSHFL